MRRYEELTPPGYWGMSAENIHIIKNFVCTDDLNRLYEYASNIQKWRKLGDNWDNRVHIFSFIEEVDRAYAAHLKEITFQAKLVMQNTLKAGLDEQVPSIVRWRIGDGQAPHADKQLNDGSPNDYPNNDIASLIYINDDYDGGEIFFPNQDIKFKPEAGSLVFFPGDVNYLHGVTEVTQGIRYTMPNFWSITSIHT